ncbi:MAG: hypothetical protein U1D30_03525 [Planctomycetota bacterium]
MRLILVLVAVVAVLFAMGIIYFQSSDGKTTITVDTDKLKEKTHQAVESGKELIHQAEEAIQNRKKD